eukprot:515346_1
MTSTRGGGGGDNASASISGVSKIEGIPVATPTGALADSGEMKSLLESKRELEESLGVLERKIAELEESYIQETLHGNVIKGFDSILEAKLPQNSNAFPYPRRIEPKDLIFSQSVDSSLNTSMRPGSFLNPSPQLSMENVSIASPPYPDDERF